MDKKRKVYAPFSLTSEAGVAQTPVEGYIDVNQVIYPTVSTGTVNEKGKWKGVIDDDDEFIGLSRAEAIAAGGEVFFPDTNNFNHIDMTGFTDIFLAIKPSAAGNYNIQATMGPDTVRFANLSPVDAFTLLRGTASPNNTSSDLRMNNLMLDSTEALTADVWNIFYIGGSRLKGQKNMAIRIVNDSGSASNIEFAFMRLI